MTKCTIPIWEKYMLTIDEAAEYYHIGENKLRAFAAEHQESDCFFYVGNRLLIKRKLFSALLDSLNTI